MLSRLPLRGDVETLLNYHWHTSRNAVWADRHPAYTSHVGMAHSLVPLRMHGDDAAVKSLHGRKMVIMSVHSEFGSSDCFISRLIFCVIYNDWVIPGITLPAICRMLKWRYDALLAGVYPSVDWDGDRYRTNMFQPLLAVAVSLAACARFAVISANRARCKGHCYLTPEVERYGLGLKAMLGRRAREDFF